MVHPAPARPLVLLALGIAVLGVGIAAPLIKLAGGAPPLAVAFWRMALSAALTGGLWLASPAGSAGARFGRRDWALAVLAGACLAVHFASWIQSLAFTTVAASVVLVNTQPAFVAVLAALFLGERPGRRQGAGIAVAMAGSIIVGLDGAAGGGGRAPLLGNLLALLGAVSAAAYYAIGRSLRQRTGIWAYVTRVYGVSAVVLVALALVLGVPLGPHPARTWLIFAALAVGPTLLGHTVLNWALRWLPASAVNVVALGEPIVAGVLAALIFGEVPGPMTAAGGAVTVTGIGLVLARSSPRPAAVARAEEPTAT